MPYKRYKNTDKLIAKWKIRATCKQYYDVFLWEDQKSFDENTNDNEPEEAAGCVNYAPTMLLVSQDGTITKKCFPKKIGEVHFIKDKWNTEIVAHELCHALIGRFRMNKSPKLCDMVMQTDEAEEEICYEFGRWFDQVYRRLWKENPL